MSNTPVEVEAPVEAPEAELSEEVQAVEATEVVEEEVKDAEEVEAETVETEEVAEELAEEAEAEQESHEPAALSRDEFTRIADEFGSDIAVKTVKDGGDYNSALRAFADGLKAENETLRSRVAELEASGKGTPATVASEKKAPARIFNTGR